VGGFRCDCVFLGAHPEFIRKWCRATDERSVFGLPSGHMHRKPHSAKQCSRVADQRSRDINALGRNRVIAGPEGGPGSGICVAMGPAARGRTGAGRSVCRTTQAKIDLRNLGGSLRRLVNSRHGRTPQVQMESSNCPLPSFGYHRGIPIWESMALFQTLAGSRHELGRDGIQLRRFASSRFR
jgi:hypothetical protein